MWCDVDVLEFSYFGAPEPAPKEQLYTEIVDDLRGGNPSIGSGSQVLLNSPLSRNIRKGKLVIYSFYIVYM